MAFDSTTGCFQIYVEGREASTLSHVISYCILLFFSHNISVWGFRGDSGVESKTEMRKKASI
ncbi:CLUMA_CG018650, isoform A [Clunio marinus]|uniref:CLUMA_CG018650, isoform A n=1 Tax=Clunio marinus TaxID=568069 RepID=A0A1J1J3K9_9DIPT|nr:CLUMA_CG018650, isoform A [Clunio marinus]